MHRSALAFLAAAAMLLIVPDNARADDLVIALREVPQSTDPHYMTSPAMFQVNSQIFEPLLRRDDDMKPQPALATSWETLDDLTWIFHLRKNVTWHDGSPFSAEDVAFTYRRAPNVPNAPTSYKTYLGPIKDIEVVDPLTLKITTADPAPSLLEKLSYVLIVSKKNGNGATTADYNSGKAMIGTGAYRFSSWVHNEKTILEKNTSYWGPPAAWDKVTYRMITNDSARVAALLAGDVDVIEEVPSPDVDRLTNNPQVRVWKRLTGRVAFLNIDVEGGLNGGKVTGPNGEKLDKNPLGDPAVRHALIESLDLDALSKRIYHGEAEPTAQYLPAGVAGHDPAIKLVKGSPERGRALLEKAGVLGKFRLMISVAQAFFPQSVQAAEAIAQLWTRAGVPTDVESTAYPVYLTNIRERKLAVYLGAYQNSTGSADNYYPTFMHSKTGSYGSLNNINYSNPNLDALIEEASRTMDEQKRAKVWRDATHMALADAIHSPLYFFYAIHASKKDIAVKMRADRALVLSNISRVKS